MFNCCKCHQDVLAVRYICSECLSQQDELKMINDDLSQEVGALVNKYGVEKILQALIDKVEAERVKEIDEYGYMERLISDLNKTLTKYKNRYFT